MARLVRVKDDEGRGFDLNELGVRPAHLLAAMDTNCHLSAERDT